MHTTTLILDTPQTSSKQILKTLEQLWYTNVLLTLTDIINPFLVPSPLLSYFPWPRIVNELHLKKTQFQVLGVRASSPSQHTFQRSNS